MSDFVAGFAQGKLATELANALISYGYDLEPPVMPEDDGSVEFNIADPFGRQFSLSIQHIAESADLTEDEEPGDQPTLLMPRPPAGA